MTVNLSDEMIEKVVELAYGRICDLKQKQEMVMHSNIGARRQFAQLREINNELLDAKEVHSLFIELALM